MIQSPAFVEVDLQRCQHLLYSARKVGVTWSRILHLVQLAGKASKVMDGAGRGGDCHPGLGHKRLRRDRENRPGARQGFPDCATPLRVGVLLEGVHRIAVTEEECWKDSGHDLPLKRRERVLDARAAN